MTELAYVLEGRPVSWQRTNIVKGRPMTDAKQRTAKKAHALAAFCAIRIARTPWPLEGAFEVEVLAYYASGVQGDTDRLVSLPLDALEGIAYRNDRQVVRVVGERRLDRERPRTEVVIRRRAE